MTGDGETGDGQLVRRGFGVSEAGDTVSWKCGGGERRAVTGVWRTRSDMAS